MPTTKQVLADQRRDAEVSARAAIIRAGEPSVVQQVPVVALTIPAYAAANLPFAAGAPNGMVRVTDNPQGTATSNGQVWISDVDGTDLGPGHG